MKRDAGENEKDGNGRGGTMEDGEETTSSRDRGMFIYLECNVYFD